MPFPSYNINTNFSNGVNPVLLHKEIKDLNINSAQFLGITVKDNITCNVLFDKTPSSSDIILINNAISIHDGIDGLAYYKHLKHSSIDRRTDKLISEGFTYSGKKFSLSAMAQVKIMGTHQIRTDPNLTYPIRWNTIDDNDYYEIIDSTDLHTFYMTSVATYRSHVDAGTALKDLVRAATSKEEVDMIIDNR